VGALQNNVGSFKASLDGRIDGLEHKIDDLIKTLPRMVGDVMQEVLNGRKT
jgi:hypothetical protein